MLELTNSLFYLISKTEGGCSGNRKYMIIETALYQDVLEHSSIFRQLPKDKYPNVLRCLNARVVDYPQDASIAALGDSSGCSGILLTGMLEEYLVDENGNQIIINHLRSGDVFGAESVCAGQVASHVYIHTVEKSKILMLDFAALLSEKTFSCSCRMQVTTNLMQEFARQVMFFNSKIRILSQKKLRDKFYLPETVEMVLYKLEKEHFLNDEAFATEYAASLSRRQMGRTRITQELRRKGIAPALIQQALESLDAEEADDAALVLARKLLRRYERESDPRKAMQKLLMAMARRGYGFEEARAAAQRAIQEPED